MDYSEGRFLMQILIINAPVTIARMGNGIYFRNALLMASALFCTCSFS